MPWGGKDGEGETHGGGRKRQRRGTQGRGGRRARGVEGTRGWRKISVEGEVRERKMPAGQLDYRWQFPDWDNPRMSVGRDPIFVADWQLQPMREFQRVSQDSATAQQCRDPPPPCKAGTPSIWTETPSMQNRSITEYLSFSTKTGASFLRRPLRPACPPNISRGATAQRREGRRRQQSQQLPLPPSRYIGCVPWITDK